MKLRFLAGAAIGYVLGTRAGRERYEQILGSLRDLTDSDLVRQIKGEAASLSSGGASSTSSDSSSGVATPPVIVGPGPDGKTGTKNSGTDTDVVLPDLETSSAATIGGDTPAIDTTDQPAKRQDPPSA